MPVMMRYFDIEYVREHLDDLVEEAAKGHSFVITVNGWAKAVVVPINEDQVNRPGLKRNSVTRRQTSRLKS